MRVSIPYVVKAMIVGIFLTATPFSQSFAQPKCYKIGIWDYSLASRAATSIVEEIYQNNGLCYEMINTSLEKARHDLIETTLDANIWRSDAFIAENKAHIVETTPLFSLGISAFINTQHIRAGSGPQQLVGRSIGFSHGDVHAKREIEAINAIPVHGESYPHTIKAFVNSRLEAIVIPPLVWQSHQDMIPAELAVEEIKLKPLHYRHILHKDNEALIPALNTEIANALARGTLHERIKRLAVEQN